MTDDLDGGFGIPMFGHVAKQKSIHGKDSVRRLDHVREGRPNKSTDGSR